MTETPEFSRPIRLDTLGESPRTVAVSADAGEREALAQRFGLIAIDMLEAEGECVRNGEDIAVTGRLQAHVTQICVASGDPVPARIDEPFVLRFQPEEQVDPGADEVELSEDDCDVMLYSNGAIDLGEAVAETLLLSLDPFPRGPDAETALQSAGVLKEDDVGPFAALKGLRDKLGKS